MTLAARIYRLERTLRPERRLHIIKLPARLAGDDAAIESALVAERVLAPDRVPVSADVSRLLDNRRVLLDLRPAA